ncbi:Beta-glucosidase cel3A [Fusarium oxysporum f. sp. albedinis]|nr:Beta-glucosidase cel3A [Fusarium oxysporum f. sp. albedinis]
MTAAQESSLATELTVNPTTTQQAPVLGPRRIPTQPLAWYIQYHSKLSIMVYALLQRIHYRSMFDVPEHAH